MATTLKNRIIRIRDEVRLGGCEHYSNSDAVLTWLVLFEVSTQQSERPASLEYVLELAFDNVSKAFRQGKIALDYLPYDPAVFSMPHIRHEMYMQSILYWCVKFDCNPGLLAEAYARVGKAADTLAAARMVEKIRSENRHQGYGDPVRDQAARTVPVFALTRPL